jgi:predicted transporter
LTRSRLPWRIMQTENTPCKICLTAVHSGGCLFILVLGISAVGEADIRWLDFFRGVDVRCYDGIEPLFRPGHGVV